MGSEYYQEGFTDGFKQGFKKGEAEAKSEIANECKYLLNCGMGKKKTIEHLIEILEKEQK